MWSCASASGEAPTGPASRFLKKRPHFGPKPTHSTKAAMATRPWLATARFQSSSVRLGANGDVETGLRPGFLFLQRSARSAVKVQAAPRRSTTPKRIKTGSARSRSTNAVKTTMPAGRPHTVAQKKSLVS